MNEQFVTLINEFLDGRMPLATLQAALSAKLSANPSTARDVLDHVERIYREGWLQPQVYEELKQQLIVVGGVSSAARAGVAPSKLDSDATKIPNKPKPKPLNDEAITPSPNVLGNDETRRPSRSAFGAVEPSANRVNESRAEWRAEQQGPIGPRSIIKGRFLLEEGLGQGGMGAVYKALDRTRVEKDDPQPYVAIKILSQDFRRHPAAAVALQREAHLAQSLRDPRIVAVYDFDDDGDSPAYMTMELLDGQQLSEVIETNRVGGVATATAVRYIEEMARGLGYAHGEGITHCDFKPGNVFVTRDGQIKILDFGIARALPSSHPAAKADSFDAAQLGAYTEAYASPEVLDGQPPEQQDDVFALGLVAYELLTGRHPFKRRADGTRELKVRPPPPPGISRRRRKALARALEFDRANRQANAKEFLREFLPIPLRHWGYAGAATAALVAAYILVVDPWSEEWLKARSFANLPLEQQQAFNNAIEQGNTGLRFGALSDSLEFFSRAFDLHPYDSRATAGLKEVANRLLVSPEYAADRRANVRVLYCQEYLATFDVVVQQCRALFGEAACREPERICGGEGL